MSIRAHEDEVFFVNPERIREIAINAVYEKYPDIPMDGLAEGRGNKSVSVSCRSASEMELVSSESEDFQHCSVSLLYHIKSTMIVEKFIDEHGLCRTELESERVGVQVFSDGSTIVTRRPGTGKSSNSETCTEEHEGIFN
jgi:hypothetical protein